MSQFIHIGFGNIVNTDKIISIISSDSAPAKRLIQKGKEQETLIDATQGRRTKSVIFTENNKIILSSPFYHVLSHFTMPESNTSILSKRVFLET